MRPLLCTLVLLAFASGSPVAKADTFVFSFVTTNGEYAASGTFEATPTPPGIIRGFFSYGIVSLTGELNGSPMTLALGTDYVGSGVYLDDNYFALLRFTAGGVYYQNFYNDLGLGSTPLGNVLDVGDPLRGQLPVDYTTFTDITVTPEPSALVLLLLGMTLIALPVALKSPGPSCGRRRP